MRKIVLRPSHRTKTMAQALPSSKPGDRQAATIQREGGDSMSAKVAWFNVASVHERYDQFERGAKQLRLRGEDAWSRVTGRVDMRRGLTLVEMLVAMAVTLIMMGAVVTIFGFMGNSIADSRASMEISERLRNVRNRLQT